jgi:HEAT repeat protein
MISGVLSKRRNISRAGGFSLEVQVLRPSARSVRRIALALLFAAAGVLPAAAQTQTITLAMVQSLASKRDTTALKSLGPGVLPLLVQLYRSGNESQRADIAGTFYQLGWKSPEAKQALMQDVHTGNQSLRINVQYALGRVSSDQDVVDVLLDNMMNDGNPILRDKAACALAYDQIHLTEQQKVRLYEGLINALSDPKPDVRSIAVLALNIQTGQTKGFDPNANIVRRWLAIREWNKWLDEYRSRW